jgi:hypothetical protein
LPADQTYKLRDKDKLQLGPDTLIQVHIEQVGVCSLTGSLRALARVNTHPPSNMQQQLKPLGCQRSDMHR